MVMRDLDAIDGELRLLAAVHRSIREHGREPLFGCHNPQASSKGRCEVLGVHRRGARRAGAVRAALVAAGLVDGSDDER
jgi:hypothetical protein